MSSDSLNDDRTIFNTVCEYEIFDDRDLPSCFGDDRTVVELWLLTSANACKNAFEI
jgi:hypothetical protein